MSATKSMADESAVCGHPRWVDIAVRFVGALPCHFAPWSLQALMRNVYLLDESSADDARFLARYVLR
jgi:hypothetical protein